MAGIGCSGDERSVADCRWEFFLHALTLEAVSSPFCMHRLPPIGALEVTVSFPFCVHFGDFLPAFKLVRVSASVWASVAKSGFLFSNLDFVTF